MFYIFKERLKAVINTSNKVFGITSNFCYSNGSHLPAKTNSPGIMMKAEASNNVALETSQSSKVNIISDVIISSARVTDNKNTDEDIYVFSEIDDV